MKYALYWKWYDGFEDSTNVDNAQERDACIRDMLKRNEFCEIMYCPIYANGEYGKRKEVLK